jgi:hypothetical protein
MSEENVDAAAVSPRPQSASDTSPAKDDVIEYAYNFYIINYFLLFYD